MVAKENSGPVAPVASTASADGVPTRGIGGRLSRRRENSAARLHGVISRVSVDLNVASSAGEDHLRTSASSNAVPSSPSRKKSVSLRFPRSGSATGAATPSTSSSANQREPGNSAGCNAAGGINESSSVIDQLEDLRLQNALLRKSLAMLQHSVVESMKGNKAQFQGNGIFKHRNSSETSLSPTRTSMGPSTAAAQEADLESLRVSLSERRASLRAAVEERDEACAEIENSRRQLAELRERNVDLQAELEQRNSEYEACMFARRDAECASKNLQSVASDLQTQVDDLTKRLQDEAATRRMMVNDLEIQVDVAIKGKHAADAESAELQALCAGLKAELQRLQDSAVDARSKVSQMAQQRRDISIRLITSLLGGTSWLRACVGAWYAWCSSEREARLEQRAEDLQQKADEARAAREVAEDNAAEKAREVKLTEAKLCEAEEGRRVAEDSLSTANIEVQKHKVAMEEAENRAKTLQTEIQCLLERLREQEASNIDVDKYAEQLKCLQEELGRALQTVSEVAAERDKIAREAEAAAAALKKEFDKKEQSLKAELQTATQAAAQSKEAASASARAHMDAKRKISELETQLATARAGLDAVQKEAGQRAREAKEAQERVETSENRVRELQKQAEALQRRVQELEESKAGAAVKSEDMTKAMQGLKDDLARTRQDREGMAKSHAKELSEVRLALAEAKSDAGASAQKYKLASDEKASLTRALEEARAGQAEAEKARSALAEGRENFGVQARDALEEARKGIRLMVTAPKVCVNVGGHTTDLHVPFPFAAIKESVQKEVMPKFARVLKVSEQAGDQEIRRDVQAMVEQLAITLQSKVHELMPQAEGTCNWDGFGAKTGVLAK